MRIYLNRGVLLIVGLQDLPILPALLQSSILALLSASLPLAMMLTSATVAIGVNNSLIHDPTVEQLHFSTSVHVFAFSSHGDLVLAESEGKFSPQAWEAAANEAMDRCHGKRDEGNGIRDVQMDIEEDVSLENILKNVVQQKVMKDQEWKEKVKR